MSTAGDVAIKIGLNFLEQAVEHIPELAGIVARGLADEPDESLVEQVRARLPEGGASAAAASQMRAERGK